MNESGRDSKVSSEKGGELMRQMHLGYEMLGKLQSGYMDTRKVAVERLGAPC